MKANGLEPTVSSVLSKCGRSAVNPATGEPFTPPTILKVIRTMCYDTNPSQPWDFLRPYQKTALPNELISERLKWAQTIQRMGRSAAWYFNNCIWIDPCSTVVPAAKRTIFDQTQLARGNRRRCMSRDTRRYSRNLRAAPYAGKQKQWADKRAWWFIILTRGCVRLRLMPIDWTQWGHGIAEMIDDLPGILQDMFGESASLPRCVMSDRGPGFYQASSGTIVAAYREALTRNSFYTFAGYEAKWQPPDIPDILMHETVAAWVRTFFRRYPFKQRPKVHQNYMLFAQKLRKCESHINANYDVDGLCRSFPSRIDDLVRSKGDRLKH